LPPAPDQQVKLLEHCAHARFVWNLAVEQHQHWRPGRRAAPSYNEQARQLTEARAEAAWLRAGSVTVQQQALRDFAQATRSFFKGSRGRPSWRKAGRNDGFRQVAVRPEHIKRLNRRHGQVWVPKAGWVRFRWSRAVPEDAKSYRVTRDQTGQWHIAFAVAPEPIPAPGNGTIVGVDLGVAVSAALSTGALLKVPGLSEG
jgi:putative transposase